MKKSIKFMTMLGAMSLLTGCGKQNNDPKPIPEDDKVHLFILAGQSGARGKALNSDLSSEDSKANKDIQIFADGYTMPELNNIPETINSKIRLKDTAPGFGDSTNEFGPELGMAKALKARFPKTEDDLYRAGIIKFSACGSTFYDDWMSESTVSDESLKINRDKLVTNEKLDKLTGPLTNNFYQIIDKAIETYSDLGYETVIDGVIFVHGEQDAKYDENMAVYEKALENFIKDVRGYVNNDDLPFVITEALTNSAKYSNKLREIQYKVATNTKNCIYVDTSDLYTNTFEPWHFGAESNITLGERAVSELIRLKDNRVIKDFKETTISLPINAKVDLPKYMTAIFEDDSEAVVPVSYSEYDNTKLGEATLKVTTNYNTHEFSKDIKINITNDPYVDGVINEFTYNENETNSIGDKVKFSVSKNDEGIFVQAKVSDNDIWTDGEAWHTGDMGQMNKNDDLEIFLDASGDSNEATSRYSIFLSSANLLRVYDKGTDTSKDDTKLANANLVYKGKANNFIHRVNTFGDVNGGSNNGMNMELFIPYSDLNIKDPSKIKMMFKYRDVSSKDNGKTKEVTSYYLKKDKEDNTNFEKNLKNYFDLEELI